MASFLGVLGNPSCRFFNPDINNSVTQSGQFFIKHTEDLLTKKGYKVIYEDTDSVFIVSQLKSIEEAEKLGKKLLGNRFKVIETTNDKMPDIYNLADVFTLASKPFEAFGMVLIEAMACGLPVVATDDPIRREIVGDAGLFVDPTSVGSYTKALKEALNTKWGNKPRLQATKFGWENIAKAYEELINSL